MDATWAGGELMSSASIEVVENPERKRYEARRDGMVLGHAAYERTHELAVFTHTEIDPAFEGQGVGSVLVREALDHVRGLGLRVLPVCPFVLAWMQRHPEYASLDYRAPVAAVAEDDEHQER